MRRPCRRAGGQRPVSRPADERGFKPKFGYDLRKGFAPCSRDPPIWEISGGLKLGMTLAYHTRFIDSTHLCDFFSPRSLS
jgi:hypothetical protein